MYLMIGMRPDIAAAVSIISQFRSNPTTLHHQAAKRILRYLKGMINMKLNFGEKLNSDKESKLPTLISYSDANWGNDVNTRQSMMGYIFYLSEGAISWLSYGDAIINKSRIHSAYTSYKGIYIITKPID